MLTIIAGAGVKRSLFLVVEDMEYLHYNILFFFG
jgi:hypothetical protein